MPSPSAVALKVYNQVLGFKIENDLENYIESENSGVRFAICLRDVMHCYNSEYNKKASGQSFELAFPCEKLHDAFNNEEHGDNGERLINLKNWASGKENYLKLRTLKLDKE